MVIRCLIWVVKKIKERFNVLGDDKAFFKRKYMPLSEELSVVNVANNDVEFSNYLYLGSSSICSNSLCSRSVIFDEIGGIITHHDP